MFTIHKSFTFLGAALLGAVLGTTALNAACPLFAPCNDDCCPPARGGLWSRPAQPPYDRPFPLGQVSDAFNESQQANAEAADFILYDYEFVGETATLTPLGRNHMIQIVRRLPHVPFPIVIEMTEKTNDPKENQKRQAIDETRRINVVQWLKMFYEDDPTMDPKQLAERVVVAPDFEYQMRADECLNSYHSGMNYGSQGGSHGSW